VVIDSLSHERDDGIGLVVERASASANGSRRGGLRTASGQVNLCALATHLAPMPRSSPSAILLLPTKARLVLSYYRGLSIDAA
jgi:hypothetical protein